jgi:hypothetical protein
VSTSQAPVATFEAPTRRDSTPNLDDPRVPEAVRQIACAARVAGHTVDVFEMPGNALRATSLNVSVWVPWKSDFGTRLKDSGARDTAMDCCAAQIDDAHQSVSWEEPLRELPCLFRLVRDLDASGVSGTGHVADGVVWHDGTCSVRWRTATRSTTVYDSLGDVEKIHGHGGATRIDWYS